MGKREGVFIKRRKINEAKSIDWVGARKQWLKRERKVKMFEIE